MIVVVLDGSTRPMKIGVSFTGCVEGRCVEGQDKEKEELRKSTKLRNTFECSLHLALSFLAVW